jgi:alpha-N-arabinofuranosidase
MRAEYYADEFRRYATFVKAHGESNVRRIACGAAAADYHWTEVLMREAGSRMDGLSLHYYTLPTGDWASKGSALEFDEAGWHATFVETLRMRELVERHSAIMDRYDPERRVGLVVDEWGTWYDPEPGREPGFLYQQSTLRDALVAAVNLCIFHAHAERVSMANIAQTINVLQSLILKHREQMLLTPTYHAFDLCKGHAGAERLQLEIEAPEYRLGAAAVPGLIGSASRNAAGAVHLTLVNLHPARELSIRASGLSGNIRARVLTAATIHSHNSFTDPFTVKPEPFTDFEVEGDATIVHLPSKSLVTFELRR